MKKKAYQQPEMLKTIILPRYEMLGASSETIGFNTGGGDNDEIPVFEDDVEGARRRHNVWDDDEEEG